MNPNKSYFKDFLTKNYFFRFVVIFIVINITYFLFSLFIAKYSSLELPANIDGYMQIHKQNDTHWYEKIFNHGYPTITDPIQFGYHNSGTDYQLCEWAFFPLYPMLVKGVSLITTLNFNYSALIVSLLFTSLCFLAFFLLCNYYINDRKKAFFITLVFIVIPFHYYYSMFYTESIFLSLLLFSFLSLAYKRYVIFGILTFLLVLLRPNGLVVMLPLFIFFLEQNGIINNKKIELKKLNIRVVFLSAIFLSAVISFGLYMLYQYYKTGHLLAFVKAQVGWNRKMMFPLFALFREKELSGYVNSLYTILVMVIAYQVWKRFPLSLNILVWIGILMPLTSGSSDSLPRYLSILFPVFIIIGDYLYRFTYRYYFLGILLFLQLVMFKYWLFAARISY